MLKECLKLKLFKIKYYINNNQLIPYSLELLNNSLIDCLDKKYYFLCKLAFFFHV